MGLPAPEGERCDFRGIFGQQCVRRRGHWPKTMHLEESPIALPNVIGIVVTMPLREGDLLELVRLRPSGGLGLQLVNEKYRKVGTGSEPSASVETETEEDPELDDE